MIRHAVPILLAAALVAGCGHEFEPPDQGERIHEADSLYSPSLFDTLSWASDSARAFAGNEVYSAKCRRCHGPLGSGQTPYAQQRGLEVPSLVRPDWAYASMDSIRHVVFTGHTGGMPIYGVAGISPREIDAAAFYVLHQLRPDVLDSGEAMPGGAR